MPASPAPPKPRVGRRAVIGAGVGVAGLAALTAAAGLARVAAVAAESPALWHTAHVAFDSPADFAADTLFGHEAALGGIPVRVDCGTGDGFCPVVRDYVAGPHPHPAGEFIGGAHNYDFWRRVAPAQLTFVAEHFG
jgi:S-formylglutathione hydrolase FrmB